MDASLFRAWINSAAEAVQANRDQLTELDAAIGDADHGINLARGFAAVTAALDAAALDTAAPDIAAPDIAAPDKAAPETGVDAAAVGGTATPGTAAGAATPGAVLTLTGGTLISTVGGASGPLYGVAFRRAGKALGAEPDVGLPALAQALEAALAGIRQLGAASEGDKTMVDALAPAVRALGAAIADGQQEAGALTALAEAAASGAAATVPMQARKGRASYLGPRSVGHEDPGAASTALILAALRDAVLRNAPR